MFSGVFFLLEHNKHCLTFMINIESSLIHSMKSLLLASKYVLIPCFDAFQRIRGLCFKITYFYEKSVFLQLSNTIFFL